VRKPGNLLSVKSSKLGGPFSSRHQ
jgi:hypothetical protein